MNIQFNNNISPNFGGYKIASIRASVRNQEFPPIDIYQVTIEDRVFLDKLEKAVDYKKLFPKLSEFLQRRWQKVFTYCVQCAHDPDNRTYIAMKDDKPCGILTYIPGPSVYLEGICTIPQDVNKKVPFVGQSLLYQLFKDSFAADSYDIKLKAVTDGPYDVVKKYEKCGFKKDPTSVNYIEMRCNKHKIKEQLKEFPYTLEYIPTEREHVSLAKFLD